MSDDPKSMNDGMESFLKVAAGLATFVAAGATAMWKWFIPQSERKARSGENSIMGHLGAIRIQIQEDNKRHMELLREHDERTKRNTEMQMQMQVEMSILGEEFKAMSKRFSNVENAVTTLKDSQVYQKANLMNVMSSLGISPVRPD